jgi:RNA polymerase sigma-70 factor (ECF subfamily)
MGRYCDGDPEAFRQLYERVAPRLLGYLASLIGERSAAEDLLQLTFLKLHEARSIYVRGADPVPWMYTIAHRTFLDEMRRRRRSKIRLTQDGSYQAEPRAEISGAPEDGASAESLPVSEATRAALAQLPQNKREALVLTKLHGRSHAEAAAITGSTVGAIKLRAHRGYTTLRQLLSRGRQ